MAKQVGNLRIVGSLEGLCFYRMEGRYFVRLQSSLTGKRFWKDPAFAGSRRSAGLLQQAAPLASALYHQLPKERKGRAVYQQLAGAVKKRLQQGWEEAKVRAWFREAYFPGPVKAEAKPVRKGLAPVCRGVLRTVVRLPTPAATKHPVASPFLLRRHRCRKPYRKADAEPDRPFRITRHRSCLVNFPLRSQAAPAIFQPVTNCRLV